uniref:Uncharacterized protein n=1 Tax=Candidatus Kentrum sp. LFY TaxID=2126342 RepID=A0A450WD96_9GAMM|nr:MAG: hypothetical protein BECKLFY1418C_GA0070996_101229 [Candidatus Kentron sp. LFY]
MTIKVYHGEDAIIFESVRELADFLADCKIPSTQLRRILHNKAVTIGDLEFINYSE